MRIGSAFTLLIIGAILYFATDWHVAGLNLRTAGAVLMLAGLAWGGLALAMYRRQRRATVLRQRRLGSDGRVIEERTDYDEAAPPTLPHDPGPPHGVPQSPAGDPVDPIQEQPQGPTRRPWHGSP